jgi:hypothetical protein
MTARLPWEITDARDALANASISQHDHQNAVRDAVKAAARADQVYRVARARKTAELRDAGKAASLCDTLARGDPEVASLAYEAYVAEGDREIAVQEGWRLHANRRDTEQLADWSKRRQLAEYHGQVQERDPGDTTIYGGKRAT